MGQIKDAMIEFCELREASGDDFNAVMSECIRGGNPTTDAFIGWIGTKYPTPPTPERPAHLRSQGDNDLIALRDREREYRKAHGR